MTAAQIPDAWRQHDAKIRPYLWAHRAVDWSRSAVGLGLLVWFFATDRYKHLEWILNARIPSPFLIFLAYFGVVALGWEILSFPFSWASWRIERAYGLSKQRFGSWIGDKAKGLVLGAVLGSAALGLVYLSLAFDQKWWLVAATFFLLFSIVLAQLAPVLLIPIFFKLVPMPASPLKERLLALCAKFRIEVKDVFHLGLGEKTEKGNAAFTGLGRTKRILIGDTLYEKYPAEQVEAVFAHELGHQVHNDLWKGIGLGAVFTYLSFFVAAVAECSIPSHEGTDMTAYRVLTFFLLVGVVQMPLGVLQAMFSRARERAADEFAAKTIGVPVPLADALERLTLQNWGLFRPNRLIEFLTYSHPAPWRRIMHLRRGT